MATVQPQTFVQEMTDRKIPAKLIGYPSQNKKRSNATHKPNASCFTFYFAPTHPRPSRPHNKTLHLPLQEQH
jgi:hypothetical protein